MQSLSQPWRAAQAYRRPLLILCVLSAFLGCATHESIRPFTTDGCSAFPEGTAAHKTLWLECCIAHDKAYWLGGTYTERQQADKNLQTCVAQVGEPKVAALMRAGARVGGSPYWPTSFRWGYGWSWPRGYRTLSPEELAQEEQMLGAREAQQGK